MSPEIIKRSNRANSRQGAKVGVGPASPRHTTHECLAWQSRCKRLLLSVLLFFARSPPPNCTSGCLASHQLQNAPPSHKINCNLIGCETNHDTRQNVPVKSRFQYKRDLLNPFARIPALLIVMF